MIQQERANQEMHHTVYPRTLVFLTHGDAVLLLKGAATKRLYPNQHNGVGGHVEDGEDVLSAARREVREETGLEVTDLHLRGVIHVAGEPGVVVFVFVGTSPTREVKSSAEGELAWLPVGQIPWDQVVPDLRLLLPRLLSEPPDSPVLFGRSVEYPDGRIELWLIDS
jgi:8-oxo-dGTP diphosphatase